MLAVLSVLMAGMREVFRAIGSRGNREYQNLAMFKDVAALAIWKLTCATTAPVAFSACEIIADLIHAANATCVRNSVSATRITLGDKEFVLKPVGAHLGRRVKAHAILVDRIVHPTCKRQRRAALGSFACARAATAPMALGTGVTPCEV